METVRDNQSTDAYNDAKSFVIRNIDTYHNFVRETMGNPQFIHRLNLLLPFDRVAEAWIRFLDNQSMVRGMGISVMKMDMEQELLAFGATIELGNNGHERQIITSMLCGGRTLEELRAYFDDNSCSEHIIMQFNEVLRLNLCKPST